MGSTGKAPPRRRAARGDLAAPVALATAAVAAALAAALAAVNAEVPEPYMDEVFHVPQAQRYCAGDLGGWDPKITTFPGLYALAAGAAAAARAAAAAAAALARAPPPPPLWACGAGALRGVVAASAVLCVPAFAAVAAAADPGRRAADVAAAAAAAALFPVHFFYSTLFYTDAPGLLFTLAAVAATLRRRPGAAAAAAAAAVAVRQTNAVWAAFCLGWAALDEADALEAEGPAGGSRPRPRRQSHDRRSGAAALVARAALALGLGWTAELGGAARRVWAARRRVLRRWWALAALVAAFAAFVGANGGVAVGDREHHAPAAHLAHPLYCCAYAAAALAPLLLAPADAAAAARAAAARPAAAAAALAAAAAAVAAGTLAHPFLLADNRHYAFYAWRRGVDRAPWARYALVPAYVASAALLGARLRHLGAPRLALLAGGAAAVLVPAPLAEPRYWTAPALLAAALGRWPRLSRARVAAALGAYAAVDAAVLWVFLRRPFVWGDGSTARFLW